MFVYLRKYKLYIQNLSLYFLASLIPMFLQVISNPFFAMNLSPEDYAIIGYYTSLNVLFAPLITFYLLHYYMKRFFEISEEERFHLRSTIFKMLLLFSFVLTLLSIIIIFLSITSKPNNSKKMKMFILQEYRYLRFCYRSRHNTTYSKLLRILPRS